MNIQNDEEFKKHIENLNDSLIFIANKNTKYPLDALQFVVLSFVSLMRSKIKNENNSDPVIDYGEILYWFKNYAWFYYGPLAKAVFNKWELKDGRDLISILDLLITEGLLNKNSFSSEFSLSYLTSNFDFAEFETQEFFDSHCDV